MNISEAVTVMRRGGAVARKGWNEKNAGLDIQVPDLGSKMTKEYIYMTIPIKPLPGDIVQLMPWSPTAQDVLADDWIVVRAYDEPYGNAQ